MRWYNTERANQTRYCNGRTPMETFEAGIELYRQFAYDEEVMEEAAWAEGDRKAHCQRFYCSGHVIACRADH
ncbi:hypothetical protein ACFL4R_01260 [Nitrospirota bacterium]